MRKVWIKQKSLPDTLCNQLVKAFEYEHKLGNTRQGPSYTPNSHKEVIVHERKRLRDFNIKKGLRYHNLVQSAESHLKLTFRDYIQSNNIDYSSTPPEHSPLDEFKAYVCDESKFFFPYLMLARYKKGKGHLNAFHVDRRFGQYRVYKYHKKDKTKYIITEPAFVFTTYLNTVQKGGRTEFLYGQEPKIIKPLRGYTAIWPTTYPYVHKGNKPYSSNKYILTTQLCYDKSGLIAKIFNNHGQKGWPGEQPKPILGDLKC